MNTTPPPAPPQVAAGTPAAPAPVAGLAYHRLSHADPKSRWFSPLLEGLLGVAVFIGLNLIISVALAVAIMGSGLSRQDVATNRSVIMEHPALFALTFLSLIAIVPSLFLARLVVGPKPWGLIHSVAGRLRRSLLLPYLGLSFAVYGIYYAVMLALSGESLPEYRYFQPPQVEFLGLCGDDVAPGARAVLRRRARLPRLHDADAGPLAPHPLAADCAARRAVHALPRLRPLGAEHDSRDGYLRGFPLLVHRRPGSLHQPACGK